MIIQAAYVSRLQQQAAQIKHLLKLLNSSSSNEPSSNQSINNAVNSNSNRNQESENTVNSCHDESSNLNVDTNHEAAEKNGGYESLWELTNERAGSLPGLTNDIGDVETTTEVEEDEDWQEDKEDLYENTGIFANSVTLPVGK